MLSFTVSRYGYLNSVEWVTLEHGHQANIVSPWGNRGDGCRCGNEARVPRLQQDRPNFSGRGAASGALQIPSEAVHHLQNDTARRQVSPKQFDVLSLTDKNTDGIVHRVLEKLHRVCCRNLHGRTSRFVEDKENR